MIVNNIFDVEYGTNLELNHLKQSPSGINFVSRTTKNNGVSAIVERTKKHPLSAGLISVAVGGSVMEAFVQPKPFYTGRDIYILKPKIKMAINEQLFYCLCIRANKFKYSYGRQANKTLREVELPDTIPNWVYETKNNLLNIDKRLKNINISLNDRNWKEFLISQFFNVYTGGDKPKSNDPYHKKGVLVNSVENLTINNGIDGKIYFKGDKQFRNFISVVSIGQGGRAFYQEELGAIFTRVKALVPKKEKFKLNKYSGMFLITILNLETYRYSYGRVLDEGRLSKTKIKLPINNKENPDWDFMEDYIKSLPFSVGL